MPTIYSLQYSHYANRHQKSSVTLSITSVSYHQTTLQTLKPLIRLIKVQNSMTTLKSYQFWLYVISGEKSFADARIEERFFRGKGFSIQRVAKNSNLLLCTYRHTASSRLFKVFIKTRFDKICK